MQIVIDISENIYNLIARGEENRDFVYKSDLMRAILEGTPQPKTGHWIKEETIYGWDRKLYQCSCCGRSIYLDPMMENLDDYPYCHCGAKMKGEVQED